MSEFQRLWANVISSNTAEEEASRATELVEYARHHGIVYEVSLIDARTGRPLPVAQLHQSASPPEVHVTVQGQSADPWRPHNVDNVEKLFAE